METKIRVEIDTNKTTYRFNGTSIADLIRWAASLETEILAALLGNHEE
jgi:hypothetical protein